jgi:hypothetical protein
MTDTYFPGLKREPLLEEELPAANPTVHLIKGARIKFASGQPTGLHRHPVSTVGVVTAGSFHLQLEGKPMHCSRPATVSSSRRVIRFSSSITPRRAGPRKLRASI